MKSPTEEASHHDETAFALPQWQGVVGCYDAKLTSVKTLEQWLALMPAKDYVSRDLPHKAGVELLKILNVPAQPSGYTLLRTGNLEQDAYRTWSIVLRSNGENCVFAHALPELLLPIITHPSSEDHLPHVQVEKNNSGNDFGILTPHDTESLYDCMLASGLRNNKELAQQDLQAEIAGGEVWLVQKHEGNIVGFVSGGPRLFHDRRGEFELLHIGVDPQVAGKGVAKTLFDGLVEYAKRYYQDRGHHLRKFWLYTAQSHIEEKDARRHGFYRKMLMEVAGVSVHKFGVGKIELEYALNFDAQGNLLPHHPLGEEIIALFQASK